MSRWKQNIPYFLAVLLMLGLLVVYVFEFYYFQRTFGLRSLLLPAAIAGGLAGAALGWRYSRTAEDAVERMQVYLFFIFLATVFFPLLASLSNRLLSPHPVQWEGVAFFGEKAYVSDRFGLMRGEEVNPSGYYLFFFRDGQLERIENRHRMSPSPAQGDTILIPVRKGLWGVEWVVSDRKPWASSGPEE